MKRLLIRRPSPALVISVLALFIALGGTVYAASKINGKTIKSNSIPGNRLKKHTLTGKQIKNHALTGTQINLAKLGTVPNATNATHADAAGTADQLKTWFTNASIGQTVTLQTIGPFTYKGECSAGPEGKNYVETSQANSAAESYEGEDANPFNPGEKIQIGDTAAASVWEGPDDGSDAQISGDGHTYVNTFTSVGTNVAGAQCVFAGYAVAVSR